MKMQIMKAAATLLLGGALLLPASPASAHALEGELLEADGAAAVRFVYAGGEAARYIKAEVYSPADRKIEFQTGRSDRLGRVVFLPDAPGQWLVVVSDNQGHRAEFAVNVSGHVAADSAAAPGPAAAAGAPDPAAKWLRAGFGLSLILNLALLGWWWSRRRRQSG